MIVVFGKRTARIGKYIDNDHVCFRCHAFDREVSVYQDYAHLCLIPLFPVGKKKFALLCRNCGDETPLETVIKAYQGRAKTPFYLYAAFFVAAAIGIAWFFWNRNLQEQNRLYVAKPAVGDIYTLTERNNVSYEYYFLKLVEVGPDTVLALHSNLEYSGFVSSLAEEDYFVKDDTVVYRRKDLNKMMDRGEVYSVRRGVGSGSGFDRVK